MIELCKIIETTHIGNEFMSNVCSTYDFLNSSKREDQFEKELSALKEDYKSKTISNVRFLTHSSLWLFIHKIKETFLDIGNPKELIKEYLLHGNNNIPISAVRIYETPILSAFNDLRSFYDKLYYDYNKRFLDEGYTPPQGVIRYQLELPKNFDLNEIKPRPESPKLDIRATAILWFLLKEHGLTLDYSFISYAKLVHYLTGHSVQNLRTKKGFGNIGILLDDKKRLEIVRRNLMKVVEDIDIKLKMIR